jgi:hypothetical protein
LFPRADTIRSPRHLIAEITERADGAEPNPIVRVWRPRGPAGGIIVTEPSGVSPEERVRRYRQYAADAIQRAANAEPHMKGIFLRIAAQWNEMASMLEAELEHGNE